MYTRLFKAHEALWGHYGWRLLVVKAMWSKQRRVGFRV